MNTCLMAVVRLDLDDCPICIVCSVQFTFLFSFQLSRLLFSLLLCQKTFLFVKGLAGTIKVTLSIRPCCCYSLLSHSRHCLSKPPSRVDVDWWHRPLFSCSSSQRPVGSELNSAARVWPLFAVSKPLIKSVSLPFFLIMHEQRRLFNGGAVGGWGGGGRVLAPTSHVTCRTQRWAMAF